MVDQTSIRPATNGTPRTRRAAARRSTRLLPAVVLVLGLAACAAPAARISPRPTADATGTWLRATTSRAIPAANRFSIGPTAVITSDGTYVTASPADDGAAEPLLPNLVARPITDAGRETILAEAGRLGLLGGKTDFRGVAVMPGGTTGRLQLAIDGALITLTGEPDSQLLCIAAPCDPLPGTPEAFGELWRMLADPSAWLAAELGPERPFVADSYAILVRPGSNDAGGQSVQDWPLDTPLATFGDPVANGTLRCGVVAGADADILRPALETASRRTRWAEEGSSNATYGLVVRPIVSGEDPCADTFTRR